MKNKNLRNAMIAGTVALIWSIPSLNIFGIIAGITSWICYSSSKKGTASAAAVIYIVAAALSIGFAMLMIFFKGMIISVLGEAGAMTGVLNFMAGFSVFGDILYFIAAYFSFRGGKELKDGNMETNGFFD